MRNIKILGSTLLLLVFSCQQVEIVDDPHFEGRHELNIRGVIDQEYVTRANDNGFAAGDKMGVYIIDYSAGAPGAIDAPDKRASNMQYVFDAETGSWNNPTSIYWKDSETPVDIYGYYPGVDHIDDPTDYRFEVSYKQNVIPSDGSMSAYEASDFMWAKVAGAEPTDNVIILNYAHKMAGVNVSLVKGSGMEDSEWSAAEKTVQIDNVVRYAAIDLSDGVPVPYGEVDKSILMLPQSGDFFRAVVVPQTVSAGKSLLSITIDGRTYTHSLSSDMVYKTGQLHNFTITVNKSAATGDYQCSLAYEGISVWVNDELTHEFSSNSYITINVPQAGSLEQIISEKGVDPADIENLKIVGFLNEKDFEYIRNNMSRSLRSINIKDVKLSDVSTDLGWIPDLPSHMDDYLPNYAFENMTFLRQVILPTELKRIGRNAFTCVELTSTLFLPEGLTHIYDQAFYGATCTIELPYSLEYIGGSAFASNQVDGVLVTGELRLTDNLKYIGGDAFWRARNFTGTFYLPSKLEYLGEGAFESCGTDLTGDIVIPSTISEIPARAFEGMGFKNGTTLKMHDGISKIGEGAFSGTRIKNSIEWPKNLISIEKRAFYLAGLIMNEFVFPDNIRKVAAEAFWNNRIGGTLVIPENFAIVDCAFPNTDIKEVIVGDKTVQLGNGAFRSCGLLERVTLGKNIDYIGQYALGGTGNLMSIVCLAEEPPGIHERAFIDEDAWVRNLSFDKCVLQVPEKSVDKYRNTAVWNQFKNITAYKELAFNIPELVTLDKGVVRQGIIRAEGPWEVIECPSWVTVYPSSGQGKAELTVTVSSQAVGSSSREGRIVFSLKDKDYTTYTDVRQVGAEVGEDHTVVLQEASAGASKAVPLFIVGDGYGAEEIASGKYLADMTQQMEYFFSIEPMKTYRDYFTVSTAYAVSPECGVNGVTRFESEFYIDLHGNNDIVREYARRCGVGVNGNESNATILVLMNTDVTANSTELYDSGLAISWIGNSKDAYPYDQKGCVLHESVGIAFGKLGPETVSHLTFLDACGCPGCNMMGAYDRAQRNGWWKNVSSTNKLKSLPWYHLMFHEKYSSIVDIYEGACNHSRGAYRSEAQSVMGNAYVPYFNTISREIIVRRIMECAGEEFDFDDFVEKDVIELPE